MAVATTDWRTLARRYAKKYGFPEHVFERQMGQEAGGRDVSSSAGAQGPAQIMPATAAAWGVKNVHDINQAYDAAAKHMAEYARQYGGVRNALIAYNAGPGAVGRGSLPSETQNYLRIVMGQGGDQGLTSAPVPARASSSTTTTPSVAGTSQDDRVSQLITTLSRMNDAQNPPQSSQQLGQATQEPQGLAYFGLQPTPGPKLADTLKSIQSIIAPAASTVTGDSTTPVAAGDTTGTGGTYTGASGKLKITGPNPGRIKSYVTDFLENVAGVFGHTLTGSDGTGHSKYTTSGNVSEHYTGSAMDLPAAGNTLTKMGQSALIAAGMDPQKARQQTGGLFNVPLPGGGRAQIIFNSNIGGNHYNHLHVGIKPGKRRG